MVSLRYVWLSEHSFNTQAFIYLILIYGVPLFTVLIIYELLNSVVVSGIIAPLAYAGIFVSVAGLLSRLHKHAIVNGRFPRLLATTRGLELALK